mgnify:CR=1 FL=1
MRCEAHLRFNLVLQLGSAVQTERLVCLFLFLEKNTKCTSSNAHLGLNLILELGSAVQAEWLVCFFFLVKRLACASVSSFSWVAQFR